MQIITIATEKGGTAKTTTAVNLAHGLARRDAQVLLIDLDAQGNCSLHLGMDPSPGVFDFYCQARPLAACIHPTERPGLDLLPGNSYTKTAAREADRQNLPLDLLLDAINLLATPYDYVVIDTHPGGYFQEVGLWMADLLIIPAAMDALSVDAVASTIDTATEISAREWKAPPPMLILPQFWRNQNEDRYNHGILTERFPHIVAEPIPHRTAAREAVSYGKTLFEYDPTSKATLAYEYLITRLTLTHEEILWGETVQEETLA